MCYWGLAYAWGPFLNAARKPKKDLLYARKNAMQAKYLVSNRTGVSVKEFGLVDSMSKRYPEEPTSDIPYETYQEYERTLEDLLDRLDGQDMDVAVLLAEAKMDLQCDERGYHFFGPNGNWTELSKQAAVLLHSVLDNSQYGKFHLEYLSELVTHFNAGEHCGNFYFDKFCNIF